MRTALWFILLFVICGCQKENNAQVFDINNAWYGNIQNGVANPEEKYVCITLDKGVVEVAPLFFSYTSGWYESKGTYSQADDGTLTFNVKMEAPDLFQNSKNIPQIILTHAEPNFSALNGAILKVHWTKILQGDTTKRWAWFDNKLPDLSPTDKDK